MKQETLKEQNFHDLLIVQIWRLIGMFVLGGLAGWLVYRSSVKDNNPNILYLFIVWGVIFLFGIIAFVINLIRLKKRFK